MKLLHFNFHQSCIYQYIVNSFVYSRIGIRQRLTACMMIQWSESGCATETQRRRRERESRFRRLHADSLILENCFFFSLHFSNKIVCILRCMCLRISKYIELNGRNVCVCAFLCLASAARPAIDSFLFSHFGKKKRRAIKMRTGWAHKRWN